MPQAVEGYCDDFLLRQSSGKVPFCSFTHIIFKDNTLMLPRRVIVQKDTRFMNNYFVGISPKIKTSAWVYNLEPSLLPQTSLLLSYLSTASTSSFLDGVPIIPYSSSCTLFGTKKVLRIHLFPFSGHISFLFNCLSAGPVGPLEYFFCPNSSTCLLSLFGYS